MGMSRHFALPGPVSRPSWVVRLPVVRQRDLSLPARYDVQPICSSSRVPMAWPPSFQSEWTRLTGSFTSVLSRLCCVEHITRRPRLSPVTSSHLLPPGPVVAVPRSTSYGRAAIAYDHSMLDSLLVKIFHCSSTGR